MPQECNEYLLPVADGASSSYGRLNRLFRKGCKYHDAAIDGDGHNKSTENPNGEEKGCSGDSFQLSYCPCLSTLGLSVADARNKPDEVPENDNGNVNDNENKSNHRSERQKPKSVLPTMEGS